MLLVAYECSLIFGIFAAWHVDEPAVLSFILYFIVKLLHSALESNRLAETRECMYILDIQCTSCVGCIGISLFDVLQLPVDLAFCGVWRRR